MTRCDEIIVQHSQFAKIHAIRIVILAKAECMIGLQPTVVKIASRIGFMDYFFHELPSTLFRDYFIAFVFGFGSTSFFEAPL